MDTLQDVPVGAARLPQVTNALDLALTELLARIDDRPSAAKASFAATPFRFDGDDRDECALDGIVADPVEWGIRSAIRAIGKHILRITGGIDGMRTVAEAVCDREPARWSRRMSAIESAWDGIGNESGRWAR